MAYPSTENLISILCTHTEIDIFTWNNDTIEITDGRLEAATIHIDPDHFENNNFFCLYCGHPFASIANAITHGNRDHPSRRPACFSKPSWLIGANTYRTTRSRRETPLRDITMRVRFTPYPTSHCIQHSLI